MTTPTTPTLETLAKGDVVARETRRFTRDSLVRYAGASGDFNPIHYNDAFAREVGLPSVIAHGMLTMGTVIAPFSTGSAIRADSYRTRHVLRARSRCLRSVASTLILRQPSDS